MGIMCTNTQKVVGGTAAILVGGITFALAQKRNKAVRDVINQMLNADKMDTTDAPAEPEKPLSQRSEAWQAVLDQNPDAGKPKPGDRPAWMGDLLSEARRQEEARLYSEGCTEELKF